MVLRTKARFGTVLDPYQVTEEDHLEKVASASNHSKEPDFKQLKQELRRQQRREAQSIKSLEDLPALKEKHSNELRELENDEATWLAQQSTLEDAKAAYLATLAADEESEAESVALAFEWLTNT